MSSQIEVDLTDEEKDIVVLSYIEENLSDATKDLFKDIYDGTNLSSVLYHVIFNEAAIIMLKKYMDNHPLSEENSKE